jgi:hypothetical protein
VNIVIIKNFNFNLINFKIKIIFIIIKIKANLKRFITVQGFKIAFFNWNFN